MVALPVGGKRKLKWFDLMSRDSTWHGARCGVPACPLMLRLVKPRRWRLRWRVPPGRQACRGSSLSLQTGMSTSASACGGPTAAPPAPAAWRETNEAQRSTAAGGQCWAGSGSTVLDRQRQQGLRHGAASLFKMVSLYRIRQAFGDFGSSCNLYDSQPVKRTAGRARRRQHSLRSRSVLPARLHAIRPTSFCQDTSAPFQQL